jgi:hypothetical protein
MTSGNRAIKIEGFRVSAPIQQPFGSLVHIVEWQDDNGKLFRKVLPAPINSLELEKMVSQYEGGTQFLLADLQSPTS